MKDAQSWNTKSASDCSIACTEEEKKEKEERAIEHLLKSLPPSFPVSLWSQCVCVT